MSLSGAIRRSESDLTLLTNKLGMDSLVMQTTSIKLDWLGKWATAFSNQEVIGQQQVVDQQQQQLGNEEQKGRKLADLRSEKLHLNILAQAIRTCTNTSPLPSPEISISKTRIL